MDYFLAIRFSGLLIVSLYVYWKILDVRKMSKSKIAAIIIFSLIMGIPLSYLPPPPLFELLFLASVFIFVAVTARVKTSLMISSVIISVGISLGIDGVVSLIMMLTVIFVNIIYVRVTGTPLLESIYQDTIIAILQLILFITLIVFINFLFKIKRLKKGILFWENKEAVRIGIVFSILIMISMSMREIAIEHFYNDFAHAIFQMFITVLVNICTFGLYFWWRNHTTTLYLQRLREDIIQEQQVEISEKDQRIKSLYESNDYLSKTVHRDNKLIPAMYNAVKNTLGYFEDIETKAKGADILSELEEIMQERRDMIMKIQREYKALPSTGIERIDTILSFMFLKATENIIEFDFILAGNIKDISESVISKQKLETLLADLLENAIIATSYNAYRRIQVTMGIVADCFEINVQDSGIPFKADTLENLGTKRATTHADEGGSGIGYLTIFEILKECGASLTVTEYLPENNAFTKSVKVCFDGKFGFSVIRD